MKTLLKFLLGALATYSFAGLISPVWWVLDLFNHFRPQAFFVSIALGAAVFAFDRASLRLALTVLSVNAVLFAVPLYATAGISDWKASPDSHAITFVAANVYGPNTSYAKAIEVITKENPDIIAFTETDARWIQNLASLDAAYPYSLKHPKEDNSGIAVYSKLPFRSQVTNIGQHKLPLAVLDFKHFRLIVAHPFPPMSHANRIENGLYIEAIATHSLVSDKPVILAGDLNSTLWGDAIEPLISAKLKRINPLGMAYTWPAQLPLFAMQIDHFFARDIAQANFKVLGSIDSDHYPIQAVINIPTP